MTGSIALAKVIEGHPDEMMVFYKKDLEALLKATREEVDSMLVGVRWNRKECISHIKGGGMRISTFTDHVLKPKRAELESIDAVLEWPKGRGSGKYLFRATVMSRWLEDNLQQITDGGWPS